MRFAECHEDRKHLAGGLCKPCYDTRRRSDPIKRAKDAANDRVSQKRRWRERKEGTCKPDRFAECHDTRAHYAKGLCVVCYRQWQRLNPSVIKKEQEHGRRQRARAKAKPGFGRKVKDAGLRHRYGLTIEHYDALSSAQNGLCAICEKAHELVVDHNHETGAIRGLLCSQCNKGLGHFGDSAKTIENAARYLTKGINE